MSGRARCSCSTSRSRSRRSSCGAGAGTPDVRDTNLFGNSIVYAGYSPPASREGPASGLSDRLRRVARPARLALAPSASPTWSHEMFGCDATQGIVSVDADTPGRARVWRRIGGRVEAREHRFPNWFLTTSLDLLAHLPARRLSAGWLRTRHGRVAT